MNSTEATSAILDYRALPEIVPPELQEAVRLQLLDEYDIVNPALAQYFRATESNLVEWKLREPLFTITRANATTTAWERAACLGLDFAIHT